MFFVYILYSSLTEKYYIGATGHVQNRLLQHNSGTNTSTKAGAPLWKLMYTEAFDTKSDALKREKQIKNKKSRVYIEFLIRSASEG